MDLIFLEVDEHLHAVQADGLPMGGERSPWLDPAIVAGWIFHDLSIEGAIFRDNELQRGLEGRSGANWSENRLLDKVRYVERAIHLIASRASRRDEFDLEFIKDIHRALCPDGHEEAGRYRKDMGPSTAYRHDIAPPTGISYRLRRLVSWTETDGQTLHPIAGACAIHRQLIEAFPFHRDNGLVARLAMNHWLLRNAYPPAIIHAQDRNEYWDAYLNPPRFKKLVVKSLLQAVDAGVRASGEHQAVPAWMS